MSLFHRLFGRATLRRPFDAPLAPAAPFHVIGDVHGHADLLEAHLDRIAAIWPDEPVVTLGDYIDRGPDSARVLRLLQARQQAAPDRLVCLMGNHEQMLLRCLDDPAANSMTWLRNGGLQTLDSFGIARLPDTSPDVTRGALADAMGDTLVAWLQRLPLSWRSGNVLAVHAAADPLMPPDAQVPRTLLWGNPDFERVARRDGIWVVHGHRIVALPRVADGRISVDTGAFQTGRLTAARISADGVAFS